jgi:hypothetical protein
VKYMRRTSKITVYLIIALFIQTSISVTSLFASSRSHQVQQAANRPQGRNQQSLPPDKQKSLTTYGPEDVFPTQTDNRAGQRRNRRPAARPAARASQATAKPIPKATPSPTQPPIVLNSTVEPSPSPSPTATPAVTVANLSQEDTPQQQPNTLMSLQNLAFLTLLVSCALIFVLFKLMSKLREGSG